MTALSSVMFWAKIPEPTTAVAIVNEPNNSETNARIFLLDMKFLPGTHQSSKGHFATYWLTKSIGNA